MSRPSPLRVIVDPAFRTIDEIFDAATWAELTELVDVVWGRDEPMPSDEFLPAVADADAVVFGGWRHGAAGLDAASPRLRALLEVAGGHEHAGLDYRRCLDAGILVGSCAPAFADVVAEMALALALASTRGVVAADREMARRTERWLHEGNGGNVSLYGATVGFVGCGGISRSLQRLLAPFDVSILGYDPPLPPAALTDRGIRPSSLEGLFDEARVVFVLAAPTPDNRGLVGRDLLTRLDVDQSLVVVSRGHLVDFEAMVELLEAGRFRAAVDVYPVEPLDGGSLLRDLDTVVTTPHLAGALPEALLGIGRAVLADLRSIARSRAPTAMQYLTHETWDGLGQVR